mgnify:CR=1 FL=1
MKIYIKFIILSFLRSFIFVTSIIFCLVFILNLLTEIDFFKDINVKYYFPIYVSFLKGGIPRMVKREQDSTTLMRFYYKVNVTVQNYLMQFIMLEKA